MEDRDITEFRRLTESEATDLVGKSILIGITYVDPEGEELYRAQMHGVVASASTSNVEVMLRGERHGQNFSLPPDPRFYSVAKPGEYRLRSTGEVINNPQVLCTAVLTQQRKN